MAVRIDKETVRQCALPPPSAALLHAVKAAILAEWAGLHHFEISRPDPNGKTDVKFEVNMDAVAKVAYGAIAQFAGAAGAYVHPPEGGQETEPS